MPRPRTQRSIREAAQQYLMAELPRSLELIKALVREGDRGCVLAGAAFIDDMLRKILESYFAATAGKTKKQLASPLFDTDG